MRDADAVALKATTIAALRIVDHKLTLLGILRFAQRTLDSDLRRQGLSDAATTLAALAGFSAEDVPPRNRGPPDAALPSLVFLWAVKPSLVGFRGCDGYVAGDAGHLFRAPPPADDESPLTASCADRPRALRAVSSQIGAGRDPDGARVARRRLVEGDVTCPSLL